MLRLIRRDEFENLPIGGTTFKVRILNHETVMRLRRECTKDGKTDPFELEVAMQKAAIAGWDTLLDGDDSPIEYSEEAVERILPALPVGVADRILRVAHGRSIDQLHREEGKGF